MLLPFALVTLISIIQARRRDIPWINIFAWLSQFLNFLIGGDPNETLSARTGRMSSGDATPGKGWIIAKNVIDLVFIGIERDHCDAAAKRKIEYDALFRRALDEN